jgi:hypothetical protein
MSTMFCWAKRKESRTERLEHHLRMALAEARLGTLSRPTQQRCEGIVETLEAGLR